jgi:hypothetical protein
MAVADGLPPKGFTDVGIPIHPTVASGSHTHAGTFCAEMLALPAVSVR